MITVKSAESILRKYIPKKILLGTAVVLTQSILLNSAQAQEVFPAPIHGTDIKTTIEFKTNWPIDVVKPVIVSKNFQVRWDGRSVPADGGRVFPDLVLNLEMLVPKGARLSSTSGQVLASRTAPISENNPDGDMEVVPMSLPITKMTGGVLDFGAELSDADKTNAKFSVLYNLELEENAFMAHESCPNRGVFIQAPASNPQKYRGFFFARCYVENNMLYMNILKPTDRTFSFEKNGKNLLSTKGQPVVRIMLPASAKKDVRVMVGEFKFEDANGLAQRYQVHFEREKNPRLPKDAFKE